MIISENIKNKVLKATGEIIFIVVGILLALYINNWNAGVQNKKLIDSNFHRVYVELEKNITESQDNIEGLYNKDSLIYLVMNDAVKSKDYFSNFNLAYLILYYHNLSLDDKAYQNLIQLDLSDDSRKEQLLFQLKDLNALNEEIKNNNSRMSSFVYEQSLPLVARNTKTFGDLTYTGKINKDVVDFFMTSQEYKSYVSQYSIIALKNQLRYYQIYLRTALKVYDDIGKEYNFKANKKFKFTYPTSILKGTFYNEQYHDTLQVKSLNDSLFIVRKDNKKTNLISFAKNHFITDNEDGRFFISFVNNEKNKLDYVMKFNFLSHQITYLKQK